MSITLDDEQTQQIFLTLAESLEAGQPLPTKLLVTSLQHPEASIRRLAVEVIQLENDPAAIPALLRATADVDAEVSVLASEVLRSFQDPAAIEHLVAALESSASETRLAALIALRERREADALGALVRRLSDSESEIRRQAVTAVANYRRRDHLPALRSALRDENAAVRKVAITAVAQFVDAVVFDDLVAALTDGNWEVRREATLANSDDSRARTPRRLSSPRWKIQLGRWCARRLSDFLDSKPMVGRLWRGCSRTTWPICASPVPSPWESRRTQDGSIGSSHFVTTRTVEFVNPPGSPSNASLPRGISIRRQSNRFKLSGEPRNTSRELSQS